MFGDDQSPPITDDRPLITPEEKLTPVLEGKLGYFFFSNKTMRDVYKDGGLDAQISVSYPVWKWLQVYGSVEYLMRSGRSLNGNQKTDIWEVPLSAGVKPTFWIAEMAQYYFALGFRYVFVHIHNDSSFVDKTLNQNGPGGFANMGFNFFPYPNFCVDLFGEYSYVQMHFHAHKANTFARTIQIGGFTFGGGLGYAF